MLLYDLTKSTWLSLDFPKENFPFFKERETTVCKQFISKVIYKDPTIISPFLKPENTCIDLFCPSNWQNNFDQTDTKIFQAGIKGDVYVGYCLFALMSDWNSRLWQVYFPRFHWMVWVMTLQSALNLHILIIKVTVLSSKVASESTLYAAILTYDLRATSRQ